MARSMARSLMGSRVAATDGRGASEPTELAKAGDRARRNKVNARNERMRQGFGSTEKGADRLAHDCVGGRDLPSEHAAVPNTTRVQPHRVGMLGAASTSPEGRRLRPAREALWAFP